MSPLIQSIRSLKHFINRRKYAPTNQLFKLQSVFKMFDTADDEKKLAFN